MKKGVSITRTIYTISYFDDDNFKTENEEDKHTIDIMHSVVQLTAEPNIPDVVEFETKFQILVGEIGLKISNKILIGKEFIINEDEKFLYLKCGNIIRKKFAYITEDFIYSEMGIATLFYRELFDYMIESDNPYDITIDVTNENEDNQVRLTLITGESGD